MIKPITVAVYKSFGKLRFRILKATIQRIVYRACGSDQKVIEAGQVYYRFYVLREGNVLEVIGNFPVSQVSFCDLCGIGFIDYSKKRRFCCKGHGEEYYRREKIGAEENLFWGQN